MERENKKKCSSNKIIVSEVDVMNMMTLCSAQGRIMFRFFERRGSKAFNDSNTVHTFGVRPLQGHTNDRYEPGVKNSFISDLLYQDHLHGRLIMIVHFNAPLMIHERMSSFCNNNRIIDLDNNRGG